MCAGWIPARFRTKGRDNVQENGTHHRAEPRGGAGLDPPLKRRPATLLEVKNISVSIRRAPEDVYAFITKGENVPRWAAGLGLTVRRVNGDWLAEGPIGSVRVRFAPPNDLGVADHDVTLASGVTVHNPIRVVPNGTGSTVIFTLLRQPGVTAREFNRDAKTVERDLSTLRTVLETA